MDSANAGRSRPVRLAPHKIATEEMDMTTRWFRFLLALGLLAAPAALQAQTEPAPVPEQPDAQGWVQLFTGEGLSGWTAPDPGNWEFKDGVLTGRGKTSHLFSPNTYTNLEFRAEARLNHSGNSGMYFRARYGKGWPTGYESQVENTSPD